MFRLLFLIFFVCLAAAPSYGVGLDMEQIIFLRFKGCNPALTRNGTKTPGHYMVAVTRKENITAVKDASVIVFHTDDDFFLKPSAFAGAFKTGYTSLEHGKRFPSSWGRVNSVFKDLLGEIETSFY